MSLYGLLRNFVEVEIGDRLELRDEIKSFMACCRVVDVIVDAKRYATTMENGASLLEQRMTDFMTIHIAVYGAEYIRPKFHWIFDIAVQWRRDRDWFVFDCFCIERLHVTVKAVANNAKNLTTYEKTVVAGILNNQLLDLKSFRGECTLVASTIAAMPGFPDARVADNMNVMGAYISVDDLVLLDGRLGKVLACVEESLSGFVIVQEFEMIGRVTSCCSIWSFSEQMRLWLALDVVQAILFGIAEAPCHNLKKAAMHPSMRVLGGACRQVPAWKHAWRCWRRRRRL